MRVILVLMFSCLSLLMTAQAKMERQLLVQLEKGVGINDWLKHQQTQFPLYVEWKLLQEVSMPMHVYLIGWEEISWSDEEVLRWFKKQPEVTLAQYNHLMAERLIPNDPLFGNQWHHVDPQDNDIDAELAWEITTGGNTALGDEIVACVVETNGAKWDQEDLIENHWVNTSEIPDNGVDDDLNGYIDDYDGWNITGNNDNSSNGNHGTQVSSMIGAKGNNGIGVSGVNWDVKIMQVQMGGISEANAIAAYTYPLVMRKLYNNTNGQQGAFVVVTNSSWGIDNGQAADSPLWCQMYDSLGYYGILSCAATANNNVNIDQVGDLPTTCPSNYLISVTATNSSDVRTFSGYGTTHIDLGAPGEAVLMAGNTSYATSSGTSFSSPCVAGAVALMYSAPCVSLAQVAQDNPSLAAQWVKNYLLQGVDPVANLLNEVATGGRLNVKNSLDLAMSNCVTGDCPAPFSVQYAPISNSSGQLISWSTLTPSLAQLQYRVVGDLNWTLIDSIPDSQISILNLLYCSEYECQVRLYCDTTMSEWSNLVTFLTDGCCQHPDFFQTSNPTVDAITIQWNNVLASNGYTVELYNDVAGTITYTTDVPQITLDSLLPCTQYQAMVFSNCVDPGDQLINIPFQTLGCTSCADIPFCQVTTGSASTEWIANVTLSGINHTSVSDGGYGNYTDVSTTLNQNQTYSISITPGFSGLAYYEYFRVWLDWNANGIWEDNELAWDPGVPSNTVASGSITVPVNAQLESIRMRVGMTYYGLSGSGEIPLACGTFNYGEFEDYCIQISNNSAVNEIQDEQQWLISPNPTNAYFFPPAGAYGMQYEIIDATGKIYLQGKVQGQIDTDQLASGCYFVKWKKADKVHFSKLMKN
jgi:serine protease